MLYHLSLVCILSVLSNCEYCTGLCWVSFICHLSLTSLLLYCILWHSLTTQWMVKQSFSFPSFSEDYAMVCSRDKNDKPLIIHQYWLLLRIATSGLSASCCFCTFWGHRTFVNPAISSDWLICAFGPNFLHGSHSHFFVRSHGLPFRNSFRDKGWGSSLLWIPRLFSFHI